LVFFTIVHHHYLILYQALIEAALLPVNQRRRDIARLTSGIVFLGTPHHGTQYSKHIQYISSVLSLVMNTNNVVLKELVPETPALHKTATQYTNFCQQREFEQICFYETLGTIHNAIVSFNPPFIEDFINDGWHSLSRKSPLASSYQVV
jgi:hypothetical protein